MTIEPTVESSISMVKVCVGGAKVVEYPLQQHATHETLRNIYCKHIHLPQSDVDLYNKLTDEINRATYHADREFLLNQRHRHYVSAMYAQRDKLKCQSSQAD